MRFFVRSLSIGLGLAIVPLAMTGSGLVAEPGAEIDVAPALINATWVADPGIAADQMLLSDENVTFSTNDLNNSQPEAQAAELSPELECMAKVVRHEAANQSRKGQRAVAEIIMNRVRSGRFPSTVCDVVNQPGQFFDIASYNPRRDTPQWEMAVAVSREVLAGEGENVAEGAYFYHAAYQAPNRFFRGRQQVMAMGDHIFYR